MPPTTRNFLRHFAEMLLAMLLGMAVLDLAFRGILAVAGTSYADALSSSPALVALAMGFNMALPMAAWMRYRGHDWARIAEMSVAMLLPAVVLVPALAAGAVDGQAVLHAQHDAMVPLMLAAMLYRRGEYTRPLAPFCRRTVAA